METIRNKHIGVYGILIKDNHIALVKKACGGYKGKLDLPGGGMEYGEQALMTLNRELMEEAGVDVLEATLIDVITTTIKWQMTDNKIEDLYHIGIIYSINSFTNELKSEPDGIDSLGADWYNLADLREIELSPFANWAVKKIRQKID